MPFSFARPGVAAIVGLCLVAASRDTRGSGGAPPASVLGGGAIPFEENAGQFADDVRFLARSAGASLILRDAGATMSLHPRRGRSETIAFSVAGGRTVIPRAEGLLPSYSNYFLGSDPTRYRSHVRHYARVVYRSVLEGVDLVYHGKGGALEYDFVIAPGARPEDAVLDVAGAEGLSVTEAGELEVRTASGTLIEPPPRIYQADGGHERNVAGRYRRIDPTRVGFEVASYDQARALVIDPMLLFATYLGGAGDAISSGALSGIAVDAAGNAFVTGMTTATDFPTTNGVLSPSINAPTVSGETAEDAFVTKLGPSGSGIVYSTYLGGTSTDFGAGIAIDGAGNVYVTGTTSSTDYPLKNALFSTLPGKAGASSGFATELSPDGSSLVYSTFLPGGIIGNAIAVDAKQAAYVAGGGGNDAVVAKLGAGGSNGYLFSLKGSSSQPGVSTSSMGTGIAVDSSGAAYVCGRTSSPQFPAASAFSAKLAGGIDAFVAKITPAGDGTAYATYLGGSRDDAANAIAVDSAGDAYITGYTQSSDFPTKGAVDGAHRDTDASDPLAQSDAFVTEIGPSGSLVYSTYLGGGAQDVGAGVAVDGMGNAFVTGLTQSTDFPTKNAVVPYLSVAQTDGGPPPEDAFVAEIATGGAAIVYSTFFGGTGDDVGTAIAADKAGNAYATGYSASLDLPTVKAVGGPPQTTNAPNDSSFVLEIGLPPPKPAPPPSSGCGCRIGRRSDSSGSGIAILTLAAVLALVRSSRRR